MVKDKRKAYIAPISWGLGDLVVSLPAVHGLLDAGYETHLCLRSTMQAELAERIEGLAGTISEMEFAEIEIEQRPDTLTFNLRNHPIQTEFWWGTKEFESKYGRLKINDILQQICRDFELPAQFAVPQRLSVRSTHLNIGTILIPGTDSEYKLWPIEHWLELARRMQDVVVIGQPENCKQIQELTEHGVRWIATPTVGDAVDLISSARQVVGVDTGLMHVAVQQGIPTIALYTHEPIYVRQYSNVQPLIAGKCSEECLAARNGSTDVFTKDVVSSFTGTDCQTPERHCMAKLLPDTVLSACHD